MTFSIPLDRQCSDTDCHAAYSVKSSQSNSNSNNHTSTNLSNGTNSINGSVPTGYVQGPSCSVSVKDTILSPSTSGTTRNSRIYETENRSGRISGDLSGTGLDRNNMRDSDGDFNSNTNDARTHTNTNTNSSRTNANDSNSNRTSSSNSNSPRASGSPSHDTSEYAGHDDNGDGGNDSGNDNGSGSGGARDVCRWIPTYTGEAFGLRHSVRRQGQGQIFNFISYQPSISFKFSDIFHCILLAYL